MMEADGIDTVAAATEVQPKTMLIHCLRPLFQLLMELRC